MASGQWYPPEWPDRIRALANGELTAAIPRRAATVMLLRPTPDSATCAPHEDASALPGGGGRTGGTGGAKKTGGAGGDAAAGGSRGPDGGGGAGSFAVHMLRRRTSMPFAAGAYAYPGGGVDPRDDDVLVGWAGPSRRAWAARLGVDEAAAQAVVCAAVRETYEESGVLLAGPTPDTLVSDITGADWEADRAALVAHELSFARFLERRGLLLRSDLLGAWARWVTPEFEPRRYDTWFFVAALPAGQRTAPTSREADRTVWITPAEAIARYEAGELTMLPPTVATLRQLSAHGSVPQVLAAAAGRNVAPVMARARLVDGEVVLSWPGHDEFTRHIPTGPPSGVPNGAPTAAPSDVPTGAPAAGEEPDVPSAGRRTPVPGEPGTQAATGPQARPDTEPDGAPGTGPGTSADTSGPSTQPGTGPHARDGGRTGDTEGAAAHITREGTV